MFQLEPSPEFSAWFESLAPALAEEVACALEVIAATGPMNRDQVTRALLWFDGTGGAEARGSLGRAFEFSEWARELLHWQREALRALESRAFADRLAALEPGPAADVLVRIEGFKRRLAATRYQVSFSKTDPFSLPALREHFFELLRRVGFEPGAVLGSVSGLCELTITTQEPRLRVLFGVNAEASRIFVILGEALTRSYYGDSVRFAERRWREYCARQMATSLAR